MKMLNVTVILTLPLKNILSIFLFSYFFFLYLSITGLRLMIIFIID